jgi:hypothetical protein
MRGGSLLIMRFVGQRSRSQLLKIEQIFNTLRFRTISWERNVGSKWNLVLTCMMVRGGSLLILRFVGQKSRSHCPSTCSQLGFRTFGALLIFVYFIWYPFQNWQYYLFKNWTRYNVSIKIFIIAHVLSSYCHSFANTPPMIKSGDKNYKKYKTYTLDVWQ